MNLLIGHDPDHVIDAFLFLIELVIYWFLEVILIESKWLVLSLLDGYLLPCIVLNIEVDILDRVLLFTVTTLLGKHVV